MPISGTERRSDSEDQTVPVIQVSTHQLSVSSTADLNGSIGPKRLHKYWSVSLSQTRKRLLSIVLAKYGVLIIIIS